MDDGIKGKFDPGDMDVILPIQNTWVVGSEPIVAVDFTSLKN
jgi:hypothetical protein